MQKVYQRINWENEPSTKTALNEDNLNKVDYALDQIDNRVVQLAGYQDRVAQAEKNAKTSETNAKTSETSAKESELKAKQYMETAFSGTPEGYKALVEEVNRIDIATATEYTLPNSKQGGYRLQELVGTSEQKAEPIPSNPIAIENTFDVVEMENGWIVTASGVFRRNYMDRVISKRHIPCKSGDIIKVAEQNAYTAVTLFWFTDNSYINSTVANRDEDNNYVATVPNNATRFKFAITNSNNTLTPKNMGKVTFTINDKYVGQIVEHKKNFFDVNKVANNFVSSSLEISTTTDYKISELFEIDNYVISWVSTADYVYIIYYDENGSIKRRKAIDTKNGSTKVSGQDGEKYFSFMYMDKNGGTTDIQIEKDTTVATPYEPYTEKVTTFFLNEPLRATDRLVRKDGVINENHKRMVIDLGTLNWEIKGKNRIESSKLPNTAKSLKETDIADVVCTHYIADSYRNIYNGTNDKRIGIYDDGTQIEISDSGYTDATEFKTAMSGVMLEYTLAEETYTPLDTASRLALNDMETFDGVTYIGVDSKVKPTSISGEYGTSQVGAYTLKAMNVAENNAIKIEDAINTMLLITP